MKVDLVFPDRGRIVDGIGDYTECLTSAMGLSETVEPTLVRVRTGRGACREMLRRRSTDVLLLQYMPFSWGRWGFAPWLVVTVAAIRLTRPNTIVGIMVHECYDEMRDFKSTMMGSWQRVQLQLLLRFSHMRAASITRYAQQLEASWPYLSVERIPASSPFSDARETRGAQRRARGWTDDDIVLCTMSSGHRTQLIRHVGVAANAVAAAIGSCTLLLLGATADVPSDLDERVVVVRPGFLEAEEIGPLIAASDVYLAPYLDGVSSRRTSMLAGLQQGVAIVGTKGNATDPEFLADPATRLTDVDDASSFGAAAAQVASDPRLRAIMGSGARRLFEDRYSFPVVARQWLDQLGSSTTEDLASSA